MSEPGRRVINITDTDDTRGVSHVGYAPLDHRLELDPQKPGMVLSFFHNTQGTECNAPADVGFTVRDDTESDGRRVSLEPGVSRSYKIGDIGEVRDVPMRPSTVDLSVELNSCGGESCVVEVYAGTGE